MRERYVKGPHSHTKIVIFMVLFILWGIIVGYSKAVAIFSETIQEGDQKYQVCTYFNGFVFATRDVRELKTVPNDSTECPFLIDAWDLGAWTPT